MKAAYRRKQETLLLPFRRLEAALWNVQIAKTKDGKQIQATDLYLLELDGIPTRTVRQAKTPKKKIHFNAKETQALTDFFN